MSVSLITKDYLLFKSLMRKFKRFVPFVNIFHVLSQTEKMMTDSNLFCRLRIIMLKIIKQVVETLTPLK